MNISKQNEICTKQLSGLESENKHILSVIAKKTFFIDAYGKCTLHKEQLPLYDDIIYYEDNKNLICRDTDYYTLKPLTDIIIKGKAHSKRPTTVFEAHVQVQNYKIKIHVIGKRKAYFSQSGVLNFSQPEIINEMPLRYDFAYGGKDLIAEKRIELLPEDVAVAFPDINWFADSPYRYPRNPEGKGFIVELNTESLDLLELPNLEDPETLLTPQNIVVKKPGNWASMPLPRCTSWVDHTWFPRVAYSGLFSYKNDTVLKEISRQLANTDILSNANKHKFNMRFNNGASLGLQVPFLKPGERINMINIHPKVENFSFQLPAEYPRIWIDGRNGKLIETKPVIHTVEIEPEESRLSIVWRGSGSALRPYHEEELKTMPYKVEWGRR